MSLSLLFATDPDTRLDAIEQTSSGAAASWAMRDVVLGDERADVRSAAAQWLGRAKAEEQAPALVDALYDTHPSVRLAAAQALGRVRASAGVTVLRRMATEEPIWWVRRRAVLSVARIERHLAIPLLLTVLDDPFWRVRYAAARALAALGEASRDEVAATLAGVVAGTSDRARGALYYIAGKLGLPREPLFGGDARPAPEGALADPDPAVVAARLEHGARATLAELVEYLGDSHESLRKAASRRLSELRDVRALLAATLWLSEPRIPHAAETVIALLDALPGGTITELLTDILANADVRPGASVWAISYVESQVRAGRSPGWDDELVAFTVGARSAGIRRAAASALGARLARESEATLAEPILEALGRALFDADDDVRRVTAFGLASSRSERAWGLLLDAAPRLVDRADPLVWRLIAEAAAKVGHVERLHEAAAVPDAPTRRIALAALFARGLLDDTELRRARTSPDPWIREAVLGPDVALDVLAHDEHPPLRRSAFLVAARNARALEAARVACGSDDAWLRARAAERLARSLEPDDVERAYTLLSDPELAVRVAAADVTTRSEAIRERLTRRAQALIAEALASATSPVTSPARDREQRHAARASVVGSPRALGSTRLLVSPLVISGANEPSVSSLFAAWSAGVNVYFWEPRYRALTTFLKAAVARGGERGGARGPRPLVVAGSYHATRAGVRSDIDRARRTLGVDRIDVFLIFWTRSSARLAGEVPRALEQAKRDGVITAAGFSTHDRALAHDTITAGGFPWEVVMVRHSLAHPGAEDRLLPAAHAASVGVLGFSATSYGRLLGAVHASGETASVAPATATECYRYSLGQAGMCACVSAPRGGAELMDNLGVLEGTALSPARIAELREHGRAVREESLEFARHIRRFPATPDVLVGHFPDESDGDDGFEVDDAIAADPAFS